MWLRMPRRRPSDFVSILTIALLSLAKSASAIKTHFVFWNSSNPIFRLDNTDHIIDVNEGNLPWEYDQLNLVCPQDSGEQHVIYSVSREEYDGCRVTSPRPKIVAICNKPEQFQYVTITFRNFSPTPGGMEFKPGQSYYLISTSTRNNLHRRVGGYCATHNMRMIFKIAERNTAVPSVNSNEGMVYNSPLYKALRTSTARPRSSSTTSTSRPPIYYYKGRTPSVHTSDYIYYYSPRDLVQLKLAARNKQKQSLHPNEIEGAAKLTGAASVLLPSLLLLLPFLTCLL